MPDGPQIVAPSVPEHGLRTVHVDHDGHRETFEIGRTADDGWRFIRVTYPGAMVVKPFAGDHAPLPIQIEWLFGIHDFDMSAAIARAIGEVMGVEA